MSFRAIGASKVGKPSQWSAFDNAQQQPLVISRSIALDERFQRLVVLPKEFFLNVSHVNLKEKGQEMFTDNKLSMLQNFTSERVTTIRINCESFVPRPAIDLWSCLAK